VEAVHGQGTPIIMQVAHCGRQTRSKITGYPTVAPSALRDGLYNEDKPKALAPAEIEEIIGQFVRAILRAKAAGFDGVQLHAAHGYLLSEFLSPDMNRRHDDWGGTTEKRFRIMTEIFKQLRAQAPGYPVLVKINGHDGRPHGMRIDEAVKIAWLLEQAGCAGIEVSSGVAEEGFGTARPEINPVDAVFCYNYKIKQHPAWIRFLLKPILRRAFVPKPPTRMYNLTDARAIKAAVSIPVIVVGGFKSIQDIRSVLDDGSADAVSLCRSLILEPNLVEKYRAGQQTEARCLACSYCMVAGEDEPLRCHYGKIKRTVEEGKG
jgi:2,4-dienoyl-CoA reductase-like NADH-dependent reductase (Old Yellow Enzyme family)